MAFGSKKNKNIMKQLADEQKKVLSDKSPWPVQEAYKALRTNIIFSLPGAGCKAIGVTSAMQHDGKTINAVNLAISFTQLGKKVLLIEADLRLPTLSKKLDIKSVPGLTDILVGQSQIGEAIRVPAKYNKLSFIPAGTIPPDPTWLLQSEQMKALLEGLKTIYEYIIIDLPPVTTVADSMILAPILDGYLLIVRDKATEYRAVEDALYQMKLANAKLIGTVYNGQAAGGGKHYQRSYYYKEK